MRPSRLQGKSRERIDQQIVAGHADLDEAQLLEIAVQAIGLGIDRDTGMWRQERRHREEGVGRIDQR